MTSKTLYKVQFYRTNEHKVLGYVRRSVLVFADTEEDALEYVEQNIDGFDGFPWDHESARVITEREYHLT